MYYLKKLRMGIEIRCRVVKRKEGKIKGRKTRRQLKETKHLTEKSKGFEKYNF